MPDAFYSVDYQYERPAQINVITIGEELEGEDEQLLNIVEREEVTALNFGKIFFGTGRIKIRPKRKEQL